MSRWVAGAGAVGGARTMSRTVPKTWEAGMTCNTWMCNAVCVRVCVCVTQGKRAAGVST